MILGMLCDETMKVESIMKIVQPISVRGNLGCDITGLAYDSRQVREGFLFAALPGQHHHGQEFIQDALRRGASAVLSEAAIALPPGVALVQVEDARRALAEVAAAFFGEPSSELKTIGITGTNGKTTVSYMAKHILEHSGHSTGLLGTVHYQIGARCIPSSRTTPEAPDLQAMLRQMVSAGCDSAVLEVSSHALEQRRVWGVDFDVAVFTNLTRDHLDYHGTEEAYFAAKARLFRGLGQMQKRGRAVINIDDAWGQRLAGIHGSYEQPVTYGLHPGADVRAEDVVLGPDGCHFTVRSPWGSAVVMLPLLGRYNVSNALAALAACGVLGVSPSQSAEQLEDMRRVPGRLERIPGRFDIGVYVDYAHTDDALKNVMTTLREVTAKRLIVVFGCGGNRDQGKRARMGAVAARLSDVAILTNDNPRTEDPERILDDIAEGFGAKGVYERIPDRESAIARALELARSGDTVLIAGKGHENYQEFEHTVIPFDDADVARRNM